MTCDCYCCVGAAEWYRVLAQSEAGVTVDPRQLTFEELWNGNGEAAPPSQGLEPRFIPWDELDVPLPHRETRCWGYALTYPEHRNETLHSAYFHFLKKGTIESNSQPIPYRNYLDYELEIGVLLHRDLPNRFGYFLANDLTDRGLQVDHYNARDPGPGFTIAKNFDGSLRAGPLLAIGDASLWQHLSATLTLNGVVRQIVRATDCNVHPRLLHDELFRDHHDPQSDPWLLAATGTAGGTLFRSPRTHEKVKVLVAGGLSMKQARHKWLTALKYLSHGDKLVLESSILGRSEAGIV